MKFNLVTTLVCTLVCSLVYPLCGRAEELGLSLATAEARLDSGNLEIISARQQLEAARADVIGAGARPNPTLGVAVSSISPSRGIGSGRLNDKQVDSVLRIDQLIERGGKRELRIATAEQLVQAAEQNLEETRRLQRLALHQAYYDLKLGEEKQRISRENSRLQNEALAASEKRLAAGDIPSAEVVRLRVEALRAANDANTAASDAVRARQGLALLIGAGREAPSAWTASDPWPVDLPPGLNAQLDADTLSARPNVRAAQFRVSAAERARELARQLRTRDVTVGAQVERFPPDTGVTYGFTISVPLQINYQYQGEIARAEADLTTAMAEREREMTMATADYRRAAADLQAAAERRRRLNEELLPQARSSLDSAEFAYKRGAISLLDVLDARRTLRSVELEAAASAADFAKARASWLAATGRSASTPAATQR